MMTKIEQADELLKNMVFIIAFSFLIFFISKIAFSADNILYRSAFVKTTVIQDSEGNLFLDLPFQIYHQTIVENGNNHYAYITEDLKNKEVIVYIHYAIADEAQVKAFSGYLGNDWKDVQKDPDVAKNWAIKKEDAFAITDELGVATKYKGEDKDELVHPYASEE